MRVKRLSDNFLIQAGWDRAITGWPRTEAGVHYELAKL